MAPGGTLTLRSPGKKKKIYRHYNFRGAKLVRELDSEKPLLTPSHPDLLSAIQERNSEANTI